MEISDQTCLDSHFMSFEESLSLRNDKPETLANWPFLTPPARPSVLSSDDSSGPPHQLLSMLAGWRERYRCYGR